jgi:archaellum biogenesis protein FlaJ (TadC family)
MATLFAFIFFYILGVFLYTIIVKNDAMHKFSPFTNVKEIAKEGAIGLAITIVAIIIVLFIISKTITFFVV